MSVFGNGNKRDEKMPPMPKEAKVLVPLTLPKAEELPREFIPAKRLQDDPHDREAMVRASAAYDTLRRQLEQARDQLEKQRDEISNQRNRIDLLEHSLAESKNVANEYRTEADEAKAETASWKVFFTNIQAVFNKYDLPQGAPRNKLEVMLPEA